MYYYIERKICGMDKGCARSNTWQCKRDELYNPLFWMVLRSSRYIRSIPGCNAVLVDVMTSPIHICIHEIIDGYR